MAETARHEVEAANAAFYAAIEAADLDAMRALWLDAPDSVCVHPGGVPVRGAGPIGRSWALVMASTDYIQFFLTDVAVALRADVASVTVTENVLTGDRSTGPDAFGGSKAVATNIFVRTAVGWRLWVHHAAPVLLKERDDDD
ncbi:MAG: nuclear transport factor 2 family protein [Nocardioidaceae bacterium]